MIRRCLIPARLTVALLLASLFLSPAEAKPVHVWEKQELTFTATKDVANPSTVVTDWVDEPSFRRFEHSPRQREYLERLWPMRAGGTMAVLRTVRVVDGPHTAKKEGTH